MAQDKFHMKPCWLDTEYDNKKDFYHILLMKIMSK